MQPIFKFNEKIIFTNVGFVSEDKLIEIFRMIQILNKMFSQIFANFLMSSHFLCFKTLFVIGSFFSIRYFFISIVTPGYQICFLTAGLSLLLVYFETDLFTNSIHACKLFRTRVLSMYKINAYICKIIGYSWDLKYEVVYPFVELDKGSFLTFVNSGVDLVVNALVATQ